MKPSFSNNASDNCSFNYSLSKQDKSLSLSNNQGHDMPTYFQSTFKPPQNSDTINPTSVTQTQSQTYFQNSLPSVKDTQCPSPTFNSIQITKQEEQFLFDLGVNLKFGDCLQKYKSLNVTKCQVIQDFPLEHLLRCDELLKSFLNILISCNFLEFGVVSYQILDKLYDLVLIKITKYLNGPHSINNQIIIQNDSEQTIDANSNISSIEAFLLYSNDALIQALYDINKMSFYTELLRKNYYLIKKVLIHTTQYINIIYDIMAKLDHVVLYYRNKNYEATVLFEFILGLYVDMEDNVLINLIENDEHEIEAMHYIKNLFFIMKQSVTCNNLIQKFERLKNESEEIEKFLFDFNNSNLIHKSIELTKQMLSGQTQLQVIIDNFYNILLSLKFLNNSSNCNESSYENIFPNNTAPLIKAICDYYQMDYNANHKKCVDLLIKLLSFKSSEKVEANIAIYNSIMEEMKVKGKKIHDLFLNREVLLLFIKDLSNEEYQDVILDIIFELFNNNEDIYTNDQELKRIFMLIPVFSKNFKFCSLQSKVDSTLSYEGIMLKYLKFLFSKNENVRFTAINFFNNNTSLNNIQDTNINNASAIDDVGDDSNLKKNYNKFKSVDPQLLIQTISNEFIKLIKKSRENNTFLNNTSTIEFTPLLNILYSTKMDYNMKTSAIEQLILCINNASYKNYFVNDILTFITKELTSNQSNFNQNNMSTYIISLLKLLNAIIYFHLHEEQIQLLLQFTNSKELITCLIPLILQKETNKHLLSAYSLMFIYFVVFHYKEEGVITNRDNPQFPVLSLYDKFYHIKLVPIELVDATRNFVQNSILNFSVTKNIIDYIFFRQNPLEKIFNYDIICSNIKNLKSLTILDVYVSITQMFSCYSIYPNETNLSENLVQIVFFFKKLTPNTPEVRNLLMDFLSILDLFLYQNKHITKDNTFDRIFTPFIQEILVTMFTYVSSNKEFMNNLDEDNQNFIYEMLYFLLKNKQYYPLKRQDVVIKFVETYLNVLVFNTESNFYKIKNLLIKFQCAFLPQMLISFPEKIFSDTINTICFFITKYDPSTSSFYNFNYIIWSLNYIITLYKKGKCQSVIQSKSFIFVKLLQSPYEELCMLSIQIIGMLLSNDLFEKHGTILSEIYNTAKTTEDKVIKVNYLNFLIKAFEFVLSNKTLEGSDVFYTELLAMNEKIYESSELIDLLMKTSDYTESIECAMVLKYVSICLNLDIDDSEYQKRLFFSYNFYDYINDIIEKEIKFLKDNIINVNEEENPILFTTKKVCSFIKVTDSNMKRKVMLSSSIESILNIKECITLIIRTFPLLNEDLYNQYHSSICEIYLNLIDYNELVVCIWNKYEYLNNQTHIKVLQSYSMRYFSYLNFVFDYKYDCSDISDKKQKLNDVCYDMMKFDSESEYLSEMKILFSKIMPYLIETSDMPLTQKDGLIINPELKKSAIRIKNEGDTLLELMIVFRKIYEIKVDLFNSKVTCLFPLENTNVRSKNDIMNAISTLLLTSQGCKRMFIKSNYVSTFLDYITQLNDFLLSMRLNERTTLEQQQQQQQHASPSMLSTNRHNIQLLTPYVINEYVNVLLLFQNLFYKFEPCEEREQIFENLSTKDSGSVDLKKNRFLIMLYSMFYDTLSINELFQNYLKLLINILSNNGGELSKYFLVPITKNKEILLNLLLEHFSKSIWVLAANSNFTFYIKSLKCLLQHKPISSALLKNKFSENIKTEVIKLIENKKSYSTPKQMKIINQLMDIFVSLSFDTEQARKLGSKEFLISLNDVLQKTKNEDVIYNILFFFRNISFVNSIKVVFMSEESLLGTIFAIFTNPSCSIRIKYIITHLLWVLLYNNQTLRTLLNREEFKTDLKMQNIHLQKELDLEKYGRDNEVKKDDSISLYNRKYLEETCMNMRKIMHIIGIVTQ